MNQQLFKHIHLYIYTYTYICPYIHILIHTYTHTYILIHIYSYIYKDDDTNGINANEIADDGCLPLNKVLKFCTDNRYDKRYTGLVWEEDSPATNGWLNVKTAVRC